MSLFAAGMEMPLLDGPLWQCFSKKNNSLVKQPLHQTFLEGKLTAAMKKSLQDKNPSFKPVRKYIDKAGKSRFRGTKMLRSTQSQA